MAIQGTERIDYAPIYYDGDQPVWAKKNKPFKIKDPTFVTTGLLLMADVQKLLENRDVKVVFFRAKKVADRPKAPEPATAKTRKFTKANVVKPTGTDEHGLPIYQRADKLDIEGELDELFGAFRYEVESADDPVVVTSPRTLTLLPSQSASLLHVNSHYLTRHDLERIQKVLKPNGRVVFTGAK